MCSLRKTLSQRDLSTSVLVDTRTVSFSCLIVLDNLSLLPVTLNCSNYKICAYDSTFYVDTKEIFELVPVLFAFYLHLNNENDFTYLVLCDYKTHLIV